MTEREALHLLKSLGYRCTKPKQKKKVRGPTCVALFSDGQVTRITTHCDDTALDWWQGHRMSIYAWQSRDRQDFIERNRCTLSTLCNGYEGVSAEKQYDKVLDAYCRDLSYRAAPAIKSIHFERDGVILAAGK